MFQLGHDFSAMDTRWGYCWVQLQLNQFQLGHDFSAMDTEEFALRRDRDDGVSIGPRLFSHGYKIYAARVKKEI